MRALILALALLFVSAYPCAGETRLSGYFEPQWSGFELKGSFHQMGSNKLRIDLEADISDEVKFGANFDYITYHGETSYNALDYLPERIASLVPKSLRHLYTFSYKDRNFLDNAYLRLSFRRFDITVGKQQISPGTGYAWNPTDLFNFKDVFDPTYEQPGHNAIRLDIPIGLSHTIVALYTPEKDLKSSGKFLRFKGRVGHFDYSLVVIEREWTTTDMPFGKTVERRRLFGADSAGELLGLGIWTEVAYNDMEASEDYWESVVGVDYTFESGTYVMAEGYHNSSGKSDYMDYDLNDWMRYFAAETKTISEDQLFAFIQHPATDLLNVGTSLIASISDGSVALVPQITYSLFPDVELSIFGNFYLGREGTLYGRNLGSGGIIRLRAYF